ncbi:MAG TPA: PAS domain S-box protein [Albitalea sp.]|uniref:PAS domain-containing hybrid sensor histidine kinase/response regulator n=1 Tax=Piscinibacter sp. TaxID=1903157 RepID=UPI002ED0977A
MSAHLVSSVAHAVPELHRDEVFRRMVEGVHDYAIFMLSADGRVMSWNQGAQRIKGYAASEIIGQHFSKFYPLEAIAAGWPDSELEQAAKLGRFEDEGWRLRKDGTRFWANVIITALHGDSGNLIGFSKITRDLTERRQHEERLRQSEENFRLLVEGAKDYAMFLLDADGAVLTWNAGAERVHGMSAEAAVGSGYDVFYTEQDVAAGKPRTELAIARQAGFSEDIGWRVRPDGSRFWADVTLTVLHDRAGVLRGFAHITRDLSERRRIQELETEGQRINEFIAMLAHELRNPLAPIGNAVGILEKVGNTPELQWCTRLIGRQVVHLSRLVDDLLDVSRITSGKIQLRQEALELGSLVTSSMEAVRPIVAGFGHTLDIGLPQEPVHVEGDPTRLTQVIVNLVTNAAKYTPNGGRIKVRLERRGVYAYLHVVDNGIGMSKQLIDTAFDLFVQGDRALDRSEGGLGIGLTLVKRIVAMHGGSVTATSAGHGQGTEMTVCLPLLTVEADEQAAAQATAAPAGGRRILVVDDNVDAATSLATLLRMSGHSISVAHDAHAALRQAAADPPDAVLLDLGLPGMDGYEVARRMRQMPALAHTRLIAMTGYGRDGDRRVASDVGFDAHLVKPVDLEDVLSAISAQRE